MPIHNTSKLNVLEASLNCGSILVPGRGFRPRFGRVFCLEQVFQFGHEFLHVFEIEIDGGEPYVRYFVIAAEAVHDKLPISLVLRSRSADSITNVSASLTICSRRLMGTGRFSQARISPLSTFWRSKRSRRPSFFTTM